MADLKDVVVPDIGDSGEVEVIEVLVSVGDTVNEEDSLITLESDKASMEVPAPFAGVVKEIAVKVGDKVSEGKLVLKVEASDGASAPAEEPAAEQEQEQEQKPAPAEKASGGTEEVTVPDIGDSGAVEVIEVLVSVGDTVSEEDSLITLESDKASMEVPSPKSGVVKAIAVKVGDKVEQGHAVLTLEVSGGESASPEPTPKTEESAPAAMTAPSKLGQPDTPKPAEEPRMPKPVSDRPAGVVDEDAFRKAHASPAVRRFARELGADLGRVSGSGRNGRILKEDVKAWIKQQLSQGAQSGASGGGLGIPPAPSIDFSKFGEIESQPLSRINKISGQHLHRCWLTVPHVTQFDEADITEMEAFRKSEGEKAKKAGFKLTPLVFLLKASAAALKQFPKVNSSLDANNENLILKKYVNIGVAVDTPNGLVVPVVKDVDKKSLFDLAKELGDISVKAREGKLKPADMQGGCFTISSLGGIGGTNFTPIVNNPEVAILGVARSSMKPVYQDGEFVPRLMLPLALSYDHRVIDGAEGARFITYMSSMLADIRRLLL